MELDNSNLNTKSVSGVFVGNPLCFSDTALKLVEAEFQFMACVRTAAVNDLLLMGTARADAARLIVIDESMLDDLIKVFPKLREAFPMAIFVLAYRRTEIAVSFVSQLHENPSWGDVGFLPMNKNMDCWLSVVRLLASGECYHPVELFTHKPPLPASDKGSKSDQPDINAPPVAEAVNLTARELQVLKSAASGMQNKNIADELELSQHTVKLHMHHIIAKLGVHNRTEAANWFHGRNHGI